MIKHEVLLQKLDERKALLRKVCLFRRDIEQKLNLLMDNSQPLNILGELKAMKEDIEEEDSHPVLPKCTPKYPDKWMFAKDQFKDFLIYKLKFNLMHLPSRIHAHQSINNSVNIYLTAD